MKLGEIITVADWLCIIRREIRAWLEMKWMYEHSQLGIRETFWDLDQLREHEEWDRYKHGESPRPIWA